MEFVYGTKMDLECFHNGLYVAVEPIRKSETPCVKIPPRRRIVDTLDFELVGDVLGIETVTVEA
jgi:hypothetical protein